MTKKNKKGFTLTELIVVIVIIGILAAVLIPSLTSYIDKAKNSAAEQEAAPIVTAYEGWLVEKDNGGVQDFTKYCISLELIKADQSSKVTQIPRDNGFEDWTKGFYLVANNGRIVTYRYNSTTRKGTLTVEKPGK